METYKLGNKVKCIIRSASAGKLGNMEMKYGNQPYTVIKDIEATISFTSNHKIAKSGRTAQLSYSVDDVSNIQLKNVAFTDKILGLMFDEAPIDGVLCNVSENFDVEPGEHLSLMYPVTTYGEIYQVFIYDVDGNLIAARGFVNNENFNQEIESEITGIIDVGQNGGNFLVFYSYMATKGYSLSRDNNTYVVLDLEISGNTSDEPNDYFIHLERCSLRVDKNLYFRNGINTVDLDFTIIPSENDYITIK
jgi:hypothetical protein